MKLLNKIFLTLALTGVLVSCEKKISDLEPIDQIPAEEAIQNMADVTSAMNGIYGTWLGRRPAYLSSFISDEIRLGTGTEYRNVGNALFNWNHVADSQDWRDDENGGCWTNLYTVIDRVNRLLELMVPVVPVNATEENLKNRYKGELLALRAMAHLELLRWYSETAEYTPGSLGVILMTEYVKTPGSFRPSRNTQQQVIDQVNTDLAEARTLIPTTFTDNGRITRNAVIATQARSALHTKNWQGVVDRATEVIASQPITTNAAAYAGIWTTRSLGNPGNQSTEVIWKLNVSVSVNPGAAIGSLWQDVNAAVQASPAVKLMNTFDQVNDTRFGIFFRTAPRNLIAKYGVVIGANGENFVYDIKMIRTSELLLARAEAYAELNQLPQANNDLSALRTARITGYSHVAINDKPTLITAILTERYKELCYEGQRYFDLRRRSLPITRDLADAGGQADKINLPASNAKYILPVPQQERFANPNCQQNAGY
jgi:starch-binding outer membrane protein, SusD/RagB family